MSKGPTWKSQKEGFLDSLVYMQGRRKGEIRSIKTPWPKWNDAGTDGIEWNSTTVIGGRPGAGKTLIKDQIIREAFKLNSADNFRVLEFSFEMMARVSALREYSSLLGKSYKYLCSADGKLTEEDLHTCHEYAKERVKYPIDVVEESCTVDEFVKIVEEYMHLHAIGGPISTGTAPVYRNTIITLDHTLLLNKAPYHSENEMLYAFGKAITKLKRKYPIAFIILSQLNRNIDTPERNEDGKYGNYILESDIFGADAMLQHADMLIGINRPGKQKIRFYGPDRYIIENDRILVVHFLKCRNGDTRMSFFRAEFEKMKISEIPTPATQERRVSTK